jgi:hypothetical protein
MQTGGQQKQPWIESLKKLKLNETMRYMVNSKKENLFILGLE